MGGRCRYHLNKCSLFLIHICRDKIWHIAKIKVKDHSNSDNCTNKKLESFLKHQRPPKYFLLSGKQTTLHLNPNKLTFDSLTIALFFSSKYIYACGLKVKTKSMFMFTFYVCLLLLLL